MITNKLFEEFQSCLDRTISKIIEPKNEYEELLVQFQGFLINELICVELSECEIVTNEIIVIRFGDDELYNIFHFTYHHEFDEIMFLEKDTNNGFYGRINPAYEEVRENGFKLKES